MTTTEKINAAWKAQERFVVDTYRHLHENPELSKKTFKTQELVCAELDKLGISYEKINGSAVVATIDTGRPGKSLLVRCDMDALPMDELPDNEKGPKKVLSKVPGACHSCGHDAHTAMMLGAVRGIAGMLDDLSGKLYVVFEDAEEIYDTAAMEAWLDTITLDGAWGLHLIAFQQAGTIAIPDGPRMAGFGQFGVRFKGLGGHGSRPDLCNNPIMAATAAIQNIHTAWMSDRDITKVVTFTVGKFTGGTKMNIIPELAEFEGTFRFFNLEAGEEAYNLIERVSRQTAEIFGCECEMFDKVVGKMVVINDPAQTAEARTGFVDQFGQDAIIDAEPWFASETFGMYHKNCPGTFGFVGCGNIEEGMSAGHHNPHFEIDEKSLEYGTKASARFVVDFLGK